MPLELLQKRSDVVAAEGSVVRRAGAGSRRDGIVEVEVADEVRVTRLEIRRCVFREVEEEMKKRSRGGVRVEILEDEKEALARLEGFELRGERNSRSVRGRSVRERRANRRVFENDFSGGLCNENGRGHASLRGLGLAGVGGDRN